MARKKKSIELRTVEEDPATESEVFRLAIDPHTVRVVPEERDMRPTPAARLEVPNTDSSENRRTHEPGVDVLIEAEVASLDGDETDWGVVKADRKPLPWGWFVLVGLLVSGAVAWSVSNVQDAGIKADQEQKHVAVVVKESEASERQMQQLIGRMERCVRSFCEAKSIEEMLPLVRHRERVRPLMEEFYAKNTLRPLGFKKVKTLQGAAFGGANSFWVYSVVVGDGKTKSLLLEEALDGGLGVDWETAVTYQPMNWDDYAQQRPEGTSLDFRIYVEEDHFFSHEFSDSNRWDSFRLTTNDGVETLFGYARKGGEVATALQAMIQQNEKRRPPAVLRLSLPQGMKSRRGVIIEKVMSSRWVYLVDPDSQP